MNQLILVKYAPEIFLKGLNRNKFERKLRDNIKKKLKDIDFQMVVDQGRHFIKTENIDEAAERIRKVFGISEVCIVSQVESNMAAIKEEALKGKRSSS